MLKWNDKVDICSIRSLVVAKYIIGIFVGSAATIAVQILLNLNWGNDNG